MIMMPTVPNKIIPQKKGVGLVYGADYDIEAEYSSLTQLGFNVNKLKTRLVLEMETLADFWLLYFLCSQSDVEVDCYLGKDSYSFRCEMSSDCALVTMALINVVTECDEDLSSPYIDYSIQKSKTHLQRYRQGVVDFVLDKQDFHKPINYSLTA